ncbi:Hypothetical protein NTJ_06406 [Nesidiocoris tenuis]|uniref:Uncharacterized protein n=1 Tax=Nesidiocoris tenuis TaxID=355587 RepID=A0ABN7AMY2_9HEMI|nr:Hypothetical protein NTJ_06406 [Nesidiocoris tenuis]
MEKSVKSILKLITFILICVTFGFSISVHKHLLGHPSTLAGAVAGGFFGYYLANFVGFLTGNELEQETEKTWAIYGTCSLFSFGIGAMHWSSGSGETEVMCTVSGIMAVISAIFCFLGAVFEKEIEQLAE